MTDDNFENRISEMIKEKLTPHINIDDEMEQMWQEILIQVSKAHLHDNGLHKTP